MLSTLCYIDDTFSNPDASSSAGEDPDREQAVTGHHVFAITHLVAGAEEMFLSGSAGVPVERTLLAGGIVEAGMQSRHRGCIKVDTPHLASSEVVYTVGDKPLFGGHGENPRLLGGLVQ